jgi:hypothetical protein
MRRVAHHQPQQPMLTKRAKLLHYAPLLLLAVVVLCGVCADGLQTAEVGAESYNNTV